MQLEGLFVALVTPFYKGEVNEEKLRELVRFQVESGSQGIVLCGTTGESPTLSWPEICRIFEVVVQEARGKITIVAGTGTNSTAATIEATHKARDLGADMAMVITPYYNKPTQEGLFLHFQAVAQSVDMPLMIYNVPARTGVNLEPPTVERLSELDTIVALKEASGNLDQISEIIGRCADKIRVFSGDDSLFVPVLSVGGVGVVSVVGNLVPRDLCSLYDDFQKSNVSQVLQYQKKLFPLSRSMFFETNPIPVKTALNILGWEVGKLRLPLGDMSKAQEEKLVKVLKGYGLLDQI